MKMGSKVAVILIPVIALIVVGCVLDTLADFFKLCVTGIERSLNSLCMWAGR